MARQHYHVIESDYGDPLGMSLRTLLDVRRGIQHVLKDYRNDDRFQVVGDGSGLWYQINSLVPTAKDDISFLTLDECTDVDCPPAEYFVKNSRNPT